MQITEFWLQNLEEKKKSMSKSSDKFKLQLLTLGHFIMLLP